MRSGVGRVVLHALALWAWTLLLGSGAAALTRSITGSGPAPGWISGLQLALHVVAVVGACAHLAAVQRERRNLHVAATILLLGGLLGFQAWLQGAPAGVMLAQLLYLGVYGALGTVIGERWFERT
jgi:hypothetical protein